MRRAVVVRRGVTERERGAKERVERVADAVSLRAGYRPPVVRTFLRAFDAQLTLFDASKGRFDALLRGASP
jgi:hypothetical protein